MDCTPDIVDLVASSGGRFAPHFHLPLQHASDRMLRPMRRPYTLDDYRRLVDRIAERLPHASIGTDLIAGFPGESDADFAANEAYLPSAPLSHLHVFPYSDRPGTEATGLPGKVAGPVIRERGARLRQIGAALSARFHDAQVGTIRPGLTLEDGSLVVTDNYLKVRIPAGLKRNERVRVRVTDTGSGVVGGWDFRLSRNATEWNFGCRLQPMAGLAIQPVSRNRLAVSAIGPIAIARRRPGAESRDDSVIS